MKVLAITLARLSTHRMAAIRACVGTRVLSTARRLHVSLVMERRAKMDAVRLVTAAG